MVISKKIIDEWLNDLNFEPKASNARILKIIDYEIVVNFSAEKIIYPEGVRYGRETTINLDNRENFVVLESVIGLFKQGYKPYQIYLEKPYAAGHGDIAKYGDITVSDNNDKEFLIIECKTFGEEFDKEWANMLNGYHNQLFTYQQQENTAKAIILYASQPVENEIERIYRAISLVDNADYLASNQELKSYKKAKGGIDKYDVWCETYHQTYLPNGVLEQNIAPFNAEWKSKFSVSDLKKISHNEVQKKYNEFATILRKHNVGGHENAFDKLVNLFLAKIVDEQQNSTDLHFNWKGEAQDSYFELVDRLQKLYQQGMKMFLEEDVTYVPEDKVKAAFRLRKDAAKEAVLDYFRQLKYFTNNDFAFLDVYNEKLFNQNSQVLVEIVLMLQQMKLKTEEQNQFLGDLFEGFLDSGVKQSEGQFFTPLPIVKFIVSSLPLEAINAKEDIPKVVDYASGAGHFLNEYAEEIKQYVDEDRIKDYYSEIYGIEKEYRLSKVAKVAAFMYGQDEIQVIYGDALTAKEKIAENSFDVLIANPPYSVKGFLETLSDKEREKYSLSKFVETKAFATNNSIELFFIERANQLLKSEGVAGIVLPSSVLSNGNLYAQARKLLLENFEILAITEFGSKTFGSTGTNTITFFLRKKKYPPKEADYYRYAVERWFNDEAEIEDEKIIKHYVERISVPLETYQELQTGKLDKLLTVDLFKEYQEDFVKAPRAKAILKKRLSKNYTKENRKEEYQKAEFSYIKQIEQEKIYYFALATSQKNPVVLVKSPTHNAAMKQFLGYEWSKRKGNEGIKYIGVNLSDDEMEVYKNQAINSIQTPLFNPVKIDDETKINNIIRTNFNDKRVSVPSNLEEFVSLAKLSDLLDFSRTDFDAQIKTTLDKKFEIVSKYKVKKIGEIAEVSKGKTITQAQTEEGNIKVVAGGIDFAYLNNKANRTANIITISASGANAGYVNFWSEPIFASDTTTVQAKNVELTKYIYNYLKSQQQSIFDLSRGAAQPHVYPKDIEKFPLPLPPVEVQKQIIAEVDKLDEVYQNSRMKIEEYYKQISEIFSGIDVLRGTVIRLGDLGELKMTKRIYARQTAPSGDVPFYKIGTLGKTPDAYISHELFEEYKKKYSFPKKGDVLISAAGTIGKTVVFDGEDAYFQDSNIVWIDNDETKMSNGYLKYLLPNVKWEAATGNIIDRLYNDIIRNTVVAFPDKKQQQEIISEVKKVESKIFELESRILTIQAEKRVVFNKYL